VLEIFAEAFRASPGLFTGFGFLLGLVVGSFLNVVALRLPVMLRRSWRAQCAALMADDEAGAGGVGREDGRLDAAGEEPPLTLVRPRSRCPGCGHEIRAHENIPVVSWLFLRGRCSACGTRISVRYPLVELATGLLTAAVAAHFGFGAQAFAGFLLTWALVALTVIDFDTQLLPDSITLPLLWLGLAVNLPAGERWFTTLDSAVVGAMAGYLSLWSVYHLFRLLTGKEGMGYGDFKLLAALGAWLGWQMLPLVILLSAVVGALVGITLMVVAGRDRQVPIPFGPYLAAAGWIALIWGEDITRAYLGAAGLG
jgi:leader peptidase (prepilin peptidase)/N-methyltransferase